MRWSTVRPTYDDDDDHISDEDDVEQKLDLDVRKMSITPRNPLSYWISNGLDEPRGMPARISPRQAHSLCDVKVLFGFDSAGRDEVYLACAKQKNMLLNMKYYSSIHLKYVLLS